MFKELTQRLLHKLAFIGPGGYSIRPYLHKLRGVNIGEKVWISQYVYLDELHPEAISIGDNSSIGLRTSIFTHFYWGPKKTKDKAGEVFIDKNVFIGPHCVILPHVSIGEGSVIQAGTVISRNIPHNTFVGLSKPEFLAKTTIPLTHEYAYTEFIRGLRPYNCK